MGDVLLVKSRFSWAAWELAPLNYSHSYFWRHFNFTKTVCHPTAHLPHHQTSHNQQTAFLLNSFKKSPKIHRDISAVTFTSQAMTPPCYTFPAAELSERVQLDVHGRQRKMLPGSSAPAQRTEANAFDGTSDSTSSTSVGRHQGIDLTRDCTLLSSMVQYSCAVMHPEMRDSPVRCWPVQRMFRR